MKNIKKKAIDLNRLTTVLLKGEQSYSDGRHDFWYEDLLGVLHTAGVVIDRDFLNDESIRRWEVANHRLIRRGESSAHRIRRFLITLSSDSELHLSVVFSRGCPDFPRWAHEESPAWDYETEPRDYAYSAPNREVAAQVLRYIKSAHPGYVNLKVKIVE